MNPGSIGKLVASYVIWIGATIALLMLPAPGWVNGIGAVLLLLIWVPYWCYQNHASGDQMAEMFAILAVALISLVLFIVLGSLEDIIKDFAFEQMRRPEVRMQNWWKVQQGWEVVWFLAVFAVWQAAPKIKKLIHTKLKLLFGVK